MQAEQLEADVRAACEAGDYTRAATLLLEGYGDELLSFLIARLHSKSDGEEVFSIFAEDLWLGLPRFAWRSSARTWAYALARNAAYHYTRAPQQRPDRNLTLSRHAELSQLVERVRSQTQKHRRTDEKRRIRALRERLDPDERVLLVLRVDRGMSWAEVARVMLGDCEAELDSEALEREVNRLRKRFERVKADLKRMAVEAGLLESG